jgi:HEAT repeat protein
VQKAARDQDAEVAQAALDLLNGYESPDILRAVETAMQHADEQIRENAVRLLENVDDPQVGGLVALALDDTSENVRSAAIAVAEVQNEDIQLAVSQTAIASPYDEVKGAAVSMLENMGNKRAVDVLIDGLKDDNSDFRETVSETLESLIDKELKSYREAKDWWNRNKNKYDDELFEIE